jgi:YesN/AraC family two-component response regulator
MMIGGNSIISIDDVKTQDGSDFYRLLARTDGILSAVKAADRDKAQTLARAWFAELSGWNATTDMVRQIAIQFMMRIMTMLDDMDICLAQPEEMRLFALLNEYDNVVQVEQCLIGLLEEAAGRIEEKRNNRERHEVVDKMLVFIRDHYGRSDLSLNLLAEQFKQSVYHLSRIFKEQTGGNFIDYVMRLRMEKAKELLRESGHKVRDIAEEVGYTNLNSFVRIFKKSTGFTPTEFREMETRKAATSVKS